MNDRKPWPARLTFLTRRLRPSVGPLDAPVRWWLMICSRHRRRVRPRALISGTGSARHPVTCLVDEHLRFGGVVGEVDVSDRFFGEPAAQDVLVRVPDPQPEQEPVEAALVEAFGPHDQQLPDVVQRVVFAAAVAERLVCHAAADLVERLIGESRRGGTGRRHGSPRPAVHRALCGRTRRDRSPPPAPARAMGRVGRRVNRPGRLPGFLG